MVNISLRRRYTQDLVPTVDLNCSFQPNNIIHSACICSKIEQTKRLGKITISLGKHYLVDFKR